MDTNQTASVEPAEMAVEQLQHIIHREPWATWLRPGGCLESAHCELTDLLSSAIAADRAGRPVPPAEGEAWEQVVWLRSLIGESVWFEPGSENASKLAHAAYVLLNQSDQIAELQRQLNRRTCPNG